MKPDIQTGFFSLFLILIFVPIAVACNRPEVKPLKGKLPGKNEMMSVNTYLVEKDRERIISYIRRKDLQMKESESGLWYAVTGEGSNGFFKDNDRITFEFECSLLDGSICYSSDDTGPKTVILGKTNIEPGLNEGLRMLKPGGSATFILPPFLAWGLHGDNNKIPPRAIVVYKIEVSK